MVQKSLRPAMFHGAQTRKRRLTWKLRSFESSSLRVFALRVFEAPTDHLRSPLLTARTSRVASRLGDVPETAASKPGSACGSVLSANQAENIRIKGCFLQPFCNARRFGPRRALDLDECPANKPMP